MARRTAQAFKGFPSCRSQSGNGWTEAYCPLFREAVADLPSAVAVDGTDVGAELERAQVTLYPLLRLPSSLCSTSTGVPMNSGKVSDGASFCLRARNPGGRT
jgi:hypothetical protein